MSEYLNKFNMILINLQNLDVEILDEGKNLIVIYLIT